MPVESAISDFTKEAQRNILDEWTVLRAGKIIILPSSEPFPSDAKEALKLWSGGKQPKLFPTRRDTMMSRLLTAVISSLPMDKKLRDLNTQVLKFIVKMISFPSTPVRLTALRPDLFDFDRTYNTQHYPTDGVFCRGNFRDIVLEVKKIDLN